MSDAGDILLRIFTGPHAGAEIVLPPGVSLLGSDTACDLILQDSSVAPRHARLLVEAPRLRLEGHDLALAGPTTEPRVYLVPLEGSVRFDPHPLHTEGMGDIAGDEQDKGLHKGQALPPGVPCFLGFTCVAWAPPDQAMAAWDAVLRSLTPWLSPAFPGSDPPQALPEDGIDADAPNRPSALSTEDSPGDSPTSPLAQEAPQSTPWWASFANIFGSTPRTSQGRIVQRICLVLLAVLLAGLSLGIRQDMEHSTPDPDALRQSLVSAGFEGLEVLLDAEGLKVRGQLVDDAARGRLVRMVQSMHYPVRLDVRVGKDLADALTAAFTSRGLYPQVRNDETAEGRLRVTGYMKDGIVEDWAFAGAREDVPLLAKDATAPTRRILHAEEVDTVLRPALTRAGLNMMTVRYLPGTVEIWGTLDVGRRESLEKALHEARQELDIPLRVDLHETAPDLRRYTPAPEAPVATSAPETLRKPGSPAQAARPSTPEGTPFTVTSVTMQPLRFITLESGERIFEGGLLPGGYTLTAITMRHLTLNRNSQDTLYPLRGNNDTTP